MLRTSRLFLLQHHTAFCIKDIRQKALHVILNASISTSLQASSIGPYTSHKVVLTSKLASSLRIYSSMSLFYMVECGRNRRIAITASWFGNVAPKNGAPPLAPSNTHLSQFKRLILCICNNYLHVFSYNNATPTPACLFDLISWNRWALHTLCMIEDRCGGALHWMYW